MYRSSAKRLSAFIVSIGVFLAGASALVAAEQSAQAGAPKFKISSRRGQSAPLRDYRFVGPLQPQAPRQVPNKVRMPKLTTPNTTDSVVQSTFGISAPSELLQFEGQSDDDNQEVVGFRVVPPDTNGDVSEDHYIQYINLIFAIYDKEDPDTPILGPLPGNAFWEGFGGACEEFNHGDPVVKWDRMAERWVFTQFALPSFVTGPSFQCFAVSKTGDPLGDYWLYEFEIGSAELGLGDYPKLGIWPDAYYIAFNMFNPGFNGMGAYAFDRTAMLAGDPAGSISFQPFDGGGLPSDMDGSTPPPEGSPNYFMTWWNNAPGTLNIYEFHVDWETPADSTFTGPTAIPTADWIIPCGFAPCVPQLDSAELLDTLSDRLMNRLAYRNFETHESLVTNFTVGTAGGETGIRWFELRNPGGDALAGGVGPFIHQEGTYAPDSNFRWMASIAQDRQGNMGLGYSISSSEMYPSIAITGRLEGDPLGTMGGEDIFLEGTGSQVGSFNRWGDYSSMSVDPVDDCTFWFTQEYYANTESFDFKTRVASFKFPSCTTGPTGTLEGTVTDGTNPLVGATVTAGESSTATDLAGHYEFTLPVGTYDMTVSRYGFLPASADDIEVTDGGTTVQDFTLEEAPLVLVAGTVRDSLSGWPLAAKVRVEAPGFGSLETFTNPVTGYYDVGQLAEGSTYTFVITAFSDGYEPGGGTLPLGVPLGNAPFVVVNWTLEADLQACSAPGYSFNATGLFEDFSGGDIPAGWTVENNSTDGGPPWTVESGADPCGLFGGNETGGSGPYAIINSNCDGVLTTAITNLISPSVNISGVGSPVLRFNSDFSILNINYPQLGEVDYSIDGGANWTNVFTFDSNLPGPSVWEAAVPSAADFKVRFHYDAFWAWWWQVDNVLVGEGSCEPGTGGLVVGNVRDESTGESIIGATVTNIGGGSAKVKLLGDPLTFQFPLYILYAEAGPQTFEATATNYQPRTRSANVVPGSTVELDFDLRSGRLSVAPTALNARVDPGGTEQQEITVTNTGLAAASFEFVELNAPLLASETSGFASEALRQQAIARLPQGRNGREHTGLTTRDLPRLQLQDLPRGLDRVLAAGDVLSSFDSNLAIGWGVATTGVDVWLSNPSYIGGGDDNDHKFTPDGTDTGETISEAGVGLWAADGAFNPSTGNFWRVAVGGDNCLHEFDPVALETTGNTICGSPWTAISQRGLAYDVATNTFFVGGWNELIVYHIDIDGNVLDSANVDIPISGMAYNAGNGHLLVMRNDIAGDDVTVLDALDNYNVLGTFQVTDGGSPVFGDFEQAGIEMDCVGNLWAINQATQVVYRIESGEAGSCEVDIPWFAVNPETGDVSPDGGTVPVSADWNAGSRLPGLVQAQLSMKTNTPHEVPAIPVSLTVRFLDVPDANQFQAYIYAAAGAGVMFGGTPVCLPGVLYFCPDGFVTRADMAGYLWRAINGRNTPPPVYQNIFADVTFNDYNAFYIQGIFDLGVTAGCLDGSVFCPNVPVTRAQMSALIWKGLHGDEPPPPCTPPGDFADVPCPSLYADYIEALADEGVTAGCGGGNFCPNTPISNGQMAVFLVKAFGLPVLLPPPPPPLGR